MENKHLTAKKNAVSSNLRDEVLKNAQNFSEEASISNANFEMISDTKTNYVSPIFSMNEDEILASVEEFDIKELATLSAAELNHIGEVLGVDPKILVDIEED